MQDVEVDLRIHLTCAIENMSYGSQCGHSLVLQCTYVDVATALHYHNNTHKMQRIKDELFHDI